MNVFILSKEPRENARMHFDSHVVKMILEAAQIACTVHHKLGNEAPYKPTHQNHPSVIWAGSSLKAYKFVVTYGLALCYEFEHRRKKQHKTKEVLLWLKDNLPDIPNGPVNYCLVMPEQYKVAGDAVTSYRNYIKAEKQHLAKWTNRPTPEWW